MFPLYDTNPHRRVPWFTLLIIAINLGVMIWESQLSDAALKRALIRHGFVPARVAQLSNPKLVVQVKIQPQQPGAPQARRVPPQIIKLPPDPGQIYASMFTMMFLHGGWLHVLGNMWFLWIFGNNVEDRLGHGIYLAFYLLGGLIALGCHYLAAPASTLPVVGASGAVAAVLGAYAVTYPRAKIRTLIFLFVFITIVDLPAVVVLALWFLEQLVAGLGLLGVGGLGQGVAWWAHVGGFVAGMVLMPILSLGAPPPDKDWRTEAEDQFSSFV
jgi:membrane associated rhomboid family serine protease